jgi:hypothetical protein
VDNRGQEDDAGQEDQTKNQIQRQNSKEKDGDGQASNQALPIEKLIHTKWADGKISFIRPIEPAKLNL